MAPRSADVGSDEVPIHRMAPLRRAGYGESDRIFEQRPLTAANVAGRPDAGAEGRRLKPAPLLPFHVALVAISLSLERFPSGVMAEPA